MSIKWQDMGYGRKDMHATRVFVGGRHGGHMASGMKLRSQVVSWCEEGGQRKDWCKLVCKRVAMVKGFSA